MAALAIVLMAGLLSGCKWPWLDDGPSFGNPSSSNATYSVYQGGQQYTIFAGDGSDSDSIETYDQDAVELQNSDVTQEQDYYQESVPSSSDNSVSFFGAFVDWIAQVFSPPEQSNDYSQYAQNNSDSGIITAPGGLKQFDTNCNGGT